jgi:hypothetical protein
VPVRDNGRPVLEVLDSLPTREDGRQPIVWIGNSHQHAINAMQPGDKVSSVYLHLALNGETYPGPAPTIGISYPNLSYEEQFLLTLAMALREVNQRPAVLVHGVRFHDAREMGVRSNVRPLFGLKPVHAWVEAPPLPPGQYAEAVARLRADFALAEEEQRKEEGFEPWLVTTLGPYLPIFQRRDFLYASVEAGIHRFRDRAFGIGTTTKRPILESRYLLSMQFIELAVRVAREQGIQVLLYNVPLRQEVENPYVASEYARFRRDLATIAAKYGATFQDYDDLIPQDLWGTWYGTDLPDFSHFTAAGHRLLAQRVLQDISGMLNQHPANHVNATTKGVPQDVVQ